MNASLKVEILLIEQHINRRYGGSEAQHKAQVHSSGWPEGCEDTVKDASERRGRYSEQLSS